jgi:hypothetical protein
MGNQPSKTAHHNKLSKPKTNTNSTGAALKTDSPISVSSRPADLSAEGRQQIRDALFSPIDDEFGSAVWAHKEDEIAEISTGRGRSLSAMSRSNSRTNSRTNSRANSKNNSRTNSRSNSLSCFGNRHGAESNMSLASPSTVDLQAAIELLQKVKKNASPEDLAALHEILENPEDEVAEPSLSRRTSVVNRTLSSLTRRQSLLQTPGVGTRNSPIEGRRRTWNSWKTPQLELEEESRWRSSPRLNSFRTTEVALVEDSHNISMARAHTPSEMDYSHLGSLRLGTLVVTNGAPPSPAASTLLLPRSAEDDNDLSATEASSSPLVMKSTRQRGHTRSMSAVLPGTFPVLIQELDGTPIPFPILPQELDGMPILCSETELNKATSPLHDQLSSLDDQIPTCLRIVNRSAEFAQSYQAEIPTSPFMALGEPRSVHQDEGFASDGTTDSTNEAARASQDTAFAGRASQTKVNDSKSSYIAFSTQAMQKSKNIPSQRPSVRTTDSGYSSGGSVRLAVRGKRNSAPSTARPQVHGSTQRYYAIDGKEVAQSTLETESSRSSSTLANSDREVLSSQPLQTRRRSLSLKPLDTSTAKSPLSESFLWSETPESATSRKSFDNTPSKTRKRFGRRRPSQSDAPIVQSCQPIPEGTIPEIPTAVRAKFERRLSDRPGIGCLTHTYPSKDHVTLEEPTTDAPITAPTEIKQLAELEPERPSTRPNGRSRSFSFFRRKSAAVKTAEEKHAESTSLGVVDLGTIASSLGTSPYNAATPGTAPKTVACDIATHPHQLDNSVPRSRSLVRMDSTSAVEFARMHSKDLAIAEREMPQQRRRSFHNMRIEAGEAKASKRRPQSSDIPPVPIINFSKLTPAPTPKSRSQSVSPAGSKGDLSSSAWSQQRNQGASHVAGDNNLPQQKPAQQDVDWDVHSKAWSQRRKSLGEGLRSNNAVAEVAHSSVSSRKMSQPPPVDMSSWGRFSGGLGYDYEGRNVGIGGSAGTRSVHSHASSKSMHFKYQYGVDLSDIPIMVQRI